MSFKQRFDFLNISETDDELSKFAKSFLEKQIIMPPMGKVKFFDGVASAVIYKKGKFQVQIFICAPNVYITPHSHPTVESYEVHLDGGIDFRIEGKSVIPKKVLNRSDNGQSIWCGQAVRLNKGVVHDAFVGSDGGTFLSIQEWPDEPELISDDWEGQAFPDYVS